jgi:hypothetical protein
MLGGEKEAPPMILAQRDMIKNEMEYYEEESLKLGAFLVTFILIAIGAYTLLLYLGKI